jgi:transposase
VFVNTVMWRLKTGAPWRDIPERYGSWRTTYNRFARWVKRGVWDRVFRALRIDDVGSLIDGSVVRAHQDVSCRIVPVTGCNR